MRGSQCGGADASSDRERRWRSYLQEIAQGDAQSLARLYDESVASLFGFALRILKNEADSEEILLEVFEQVWRSAGTFDPLRGSAWRWLALLTRSRAVDRLRRGAVRREREHPAVGGDWDVMSTDPLPDQTSMFHQQQLSVKQALSGLPREQRQAVELAFFSELTHVEIAVKLGVPLGTIKTRIRAAMEKLRGALGQRTQVMAGTAQ
jgi:RNA polymerase sigma-70 factor (ECF subfamily)